MSKIAESKKPKITFENTAFITFNYDISFDLALHNTLRREGWMLHYGLGNSNSTRHCQLLKLHGSINWFICPDCNELFAVDWEEYRNRLKIDNSPGEFKLSFLEYFHEFKKCQCNSVKYNCVPAIVPPTWNKTEFDDQIAQVLQRTAESMAHAETSTS